MLKDFGNSTISFIKNHKAEILIGAGIIGNTVATIFACKKTLTAKSIIKDHYDRRNAIDDAKEICRREIKIYDVQNGKEEGGRLYTDQKPCSDEAYENFNQYLNHDYKKDLAKTYGLTAVKAMKHYAIPAVLYVASNVAICVGTGILTKQVAGLTTALASVTSAFSNYRDHVKKVVGEEVENRIYTNEQVETRKYKDIDDNGEEIEKEETVVKTGGKNDPYALLLTRTCYPYHNDINTTLRELKLLEKELNEMLRGRGIVLLNEVYEALGCAKTEAGAIVGWIYDPNNQEAYGDGYISFGLFDHIDQYGNVSSDGLCLNDQWQTILESHNSSSKNDTDEYDIWLHFNVDGPVLKYLDKIPGKPL